MIMRAYQIAAVALLLLTGVAGAAAKGGGEADARALLQAFLKPGADRAALSKRLQPQAADYQAIFEGDAAQKAEAMYKPAWDAGKVVLEGKPGQTELKLWSASTEDLQAGTGNAREFPGGYKKIAGMLKKGLVFYRFKFVEPGQDLGMAYDGLVYVNGRFVWCPKPWRMMGN